MDTLTHTPATTRLPSVTAILTTTALAAGASAGLNLLLRYAAVTVFDIPQPQFEPLTAGPVATSSVVATVAGGLFFALLSRLTRRPLRIFLRAGALIVAAYWLAQGGAVLVPGAAAVDPQFADRIPTVAGMQLNQVVLDVVLLALTAGGYLWQRARRRALHTAAPATRCWVERTRYPASCWAPPVPIDTLHNDAEHGVVPAAIEAPGRCPD